MVAGSLDVSRCQRPGVMDSEDDLLGLEVYGVGDVDSEREYTPLQVTIDYFNVILPTLVNCLSTCSVYWYESRTNPLLLLSNMFWVGVMLFLHDKTVLLGIWVMVSVMWFVSLYQAAFPPPVTECFMVKAALVKGTVVCWW